MIGGWVEDYKCFCALLPNLVTRPLFTGQIAGAGADVCAATSMRCTWNRLLPLHDSIYSKEDNQSMQISADGIPVRTVYVAKIQAHGLVLQAMTHSRAPNPQRAQPTSRKPLQSSPNCQWCGRGHNGTVAVYSKIQTRESWLVRLPHYLYPFVDPPPSLVLFHQVSLLSSIAVVGFALSCACNAFQGSM